MKPNEILSQIAEEYPKAQQHIEAAEELILAMEDAGENTGDLRQKLSKARVKTASWGKMLNQRGLVK